MIVTGSRDNMVRVWDAHGGSSDEPHQTLVAHQNFVYALLSSPSGALLSASYDGEIVEWDLGTGTAKATLKGHGDAAYQQRTVTSLAPATDGTVISGGWDKKVRVWAGETCNATLTGHEAAVWAVLGLPNGDIVSGSADKTIRIWRGGECVKVIAAHTDAVRGLALLPGVGFVSVGNDGMIKVWANDGSELHSLVGGDQYIYSVAVSPDGSEIYTCGEDKTLKIWREMECRQVIPQPAVVWDVAVLPSGDVVTGCSDNIARVWTRDPSRAANEEALLLYQGRLDAATISASTMGGLPEDKIEPPSALMSPGGQGNAQKFIREESGDRKSVV